MSHTHKLLGMSHAEYSARWGVWFIDRLNIQMPPHMVFVAGCLACLLLIVVPCLLHQYNQVNMETISSRYLSLNKWLGSLKYSHFKGDQSSLSSQEMSVWEHFKDSSVVSKP